MARGFEPQETTPTDTKTSQILKSWVFPPETRCIPDDQYIDLEIIDLSTFSSVEDDPADSSACRTCSFSHQGPRRGNTSVHTDHDHAHAHEGIESSPVPQSQDLDEEITARVLKALRSTGFVAFKGHGLSSQEIQRQFDLGRMLNEDVGEEEKRQLHARIKEEGSWAGYKVREQVTTVHVR
jgi:hypothetical protein